MFLKTVLLFCSLLIFCRSEGYAMKIYLLSNHGNVGDHNQVLGVLTALQSLSRQDLSVKDLDTKATSPATIKEAIEKDLSHETVIVLGAGEGGIDGTTDLSANENLIICLSSHAFLPRYTDPALLEKVSFIALPIHISEEKKALLKEKLIETIGVSHNRHPEDADKVYREWGKKEIPTAPRYFGVILGGDATLPESKEIRLFTEQDANDLAEYVASNANGAYILVLNGPRTGKHDELQKEILTVHRNGDADRITNLFKEKLSEKGISHIKIFDFQHASNVPFNYVDLVAGALRAKGGAILVPGESSTSISEAVDTLSPNQIIVYNNSAMNDVHKAHVASEFAAGRIAVLENYKTITPRLASSPPVSSAAMAIAQKLLEKVRN